MRRFLPWIFTFALGLSCGWLVSHHSADRPAPAFLTDAPTEVSIAIPGQPVRRLRVVEVTTQTTDVWPETVPGRTRVMLWRPQNERSGKVLYSALWCE